LLVGQCVVPAGAAHETGTVAGRDSESARAFSCMLADASAMPTRVNRRIMSGLIEVSLHDVF
jgi:hypothetical protein